MGKTRKIAFHNQIIIVVILLVFTSTLTIGLVSQMIAKESLNRRGEIILKNSVLHAKELISTYHTLVENGVVEEEIAIETIKESLIGPMQIDGTRIRTSEINLGESGYFIIYDKDGNEVMHPSIEGQNAWDEFDAEDEDHKIVQEQIELGINGGGFVYYSWQLPNSDETGKKISYGEYSEEWQWIVVATAYEVDFNSDAKNILIINISLLGLLIVIVWVVFSRFVNVLLHPLSQLNIGMKGVSEGEFNTIEIVTSSDELKLLGEGYNRMITNLIDAKVDVDSSNKKIKYLAYHDELTGLPNRYGMKDYVSKKIKEACKSAYIVQGNLQGLKMINSVLGYEQGNRLLTLVGHFFINVQNSDCYIARTSSNEFTMWVEADSIKEVEEVVTEFRYSLKQYITSNGFNQMIDMFVTIASYPEHGDSFDALYKHVSVAMKLAKDDNDLRVKVYDDEMIQLVEHELSMRKYLKTAIMNHEIVAYYQKKVNYVTNETVGVEALARWFSEDLGFVSPAIFIPAITQLNLMADFSEYMIDMVFSDYTKLVEKYGRQVSVSINISPNYFMDPSFVANLKSALDRHLIPANKVVLEVTEDVFITDQQSINGIIKEIHELGVKVSIDDFGTGYSSLNYLTNMDFDEMKIDKSFIDQILSDDKVFKMFEILCDIAKVYDYSIVAEGVETEEQLNKIKGTSLKVIQGYIFSKPEAL